MRIDKYLKVSRLVKRRTVANEVADAGRVVVNGRPVDVDMGHEAAYVYIAGRKFRLRSDVLTEED